MPTDNDNAPQAEQERFEQHIEGQFIPKVYCSHSELVPLFELKAHPQNPKSHPVEQLQAFAEIIKGNGIRRPITVSRRSGFIVAGHGLFQALEMMGALKAPVDYQDFKDEAHELAHLAADNKLAEYGVVNEAQLNNVVRHIEANGLDKALAGVLSELEEIIDEEKKEDDCQFPLVPDYDEGYNGVIIFCRGELEWTQLTTMLPLPRKINRKGNIGTTRVLHAKEFFEMVKKLRATPDANIPAPAPAAPTTEGN